MDAATTPTTLVPTAIVKPFSQTPSQTPPSRQSTAISSISGSTQTSTSAAHQGHSSATSSNTQAGTLRPAHLSISRPRTMSASQGEMPAALDLSALTRDQPASAALDLSSTGRQTSAVSGSRVLDLTSPGRRGPPSGRGGVGVGAGAGSSSEVIDLTSSSHGGVPHVSPPPASQGLVRRINLPVDLQSPSRSTGSAWGPPLQGSSPRAFPRSSVVDLTASPPDVHRPVQGFCSPGSLQSPGGARASFPHSRQAAGQATPPQSRNPISPFSSPLNPSSSAASSPVTLRPSTSTADEASDLDLESDQGDDLALTTPDRLTSDVRHHFHGDLQ